MNIKLLKQTVDLLGIALILCVSVQSAMAITTLPSPILMHQTEVTLLTAPDQGEPKTILAGTIHSGGPFTLRTFNLTIPTEDGGSECLTASYGLGDGQDEVRVTITAGGEVYNFINFLQTREGVDDFLGSYLDLYSRYHGNGTSESDPTLVKPGASIPERMMHFLTWLDEQLLISEDREYGTARKLAWLQSEAYARFLPHAAGLLCQVSYADETVVDNAWVKSLTFQDMATVFDFPVLQVLDREMPLPERDEMESFALGIVPLGTNQPPGGGDGDWGFGDYFDCWNQTWTGGGCRSCCNDWYAQAGTICALLAFANPPAGAACAMAASTAYWYCRLGCGLANPVISQEWTGGA